MLYDRRVNKISDNCRRHNSCVYIADVPSNFRLFIKSQKALPRRVVEEQVCVAHVFQFFFKKLLLFTGIVIS